MYRSESDQEKIDRLKKLDEGNRERSKKYLEKVRKAGKKQISAFLGAEAYNELCKRRDAAMLAGTPLSFGDIIGRLLVPIINIDDNSNVKIDLGIDKKDSANIDVKETIPDCHGKKLTQGELDEILLKVDELYPKGGEGNPQRRVDALNDSGVGLRNKQLKFGSVHWDKKKVASNIVHAKKRLKKKLNPSSE